MEERLISYYTIFKAIYLVITVLAHVVSADENVDQFPLLIWHVWVEVSFKFGDKITGLGGQVVGDAAGNGRVQLGHLPLGHFAIPVRLTQQRRIEMTDYI